MKLIVAVDQNWGIGKEGDLLTSIPDDMRFFRETTQRRVLVMGSKTLRSFKNSRPLPGRLNIVLTRSEAKFGGAVSCRSVEQLLSLLSQFSSDDVMVIGGGLIYRQLLPYCSTAYITKMQFDGGADAFMANLDRLGSWEAANESEEKEHEGLKYSFVEYKNNDVTPIEFNSACTDMSSYFKPKKVLDVNMSDDSEFLAELRALLRAYFKPLADGFGAADVDEFLAQSGASFENYLREKGLIVSEEDFAALSEKFPSNQIRQISKEEADAI